MKEADGAPFSLEQIAWLDQKFADKFAAQEERLMAKLEARMEELFAAHEARMARIFGFQVSVVNTPRFSIPDTFKGKDCAICLEALESPSPDEIALTKCNHAFHWRCLVAWQRASTNWPCPVCRHCLVATCVQNTEPSSMSTSSPPPGAGRTGTWPPPRQWPW